MDSNSKNKEMRKKKKEGRRKGKIVGWHGDGKCEGLSPCLLESYPLCNIFGSPNLCIPLR